MPLPDLLTALERDAGAQVEAILAAARAEVQRVTAEVEARIADRSAAARATTETVRRGELERDLARARREAQARVLAARSLLLDRVESKLRELLPLAIDRPGYRETLDAALREALAGVDGGKVEIRCTPALVTPIRRLIADRRETTVAADGEIGSGFVASAEGGGVTVDATLEARLTRERPQLALAAMALLEADR